MDYEQMYKKIKNITDDYLEDGKSGLSAVESMRLIRIIIRTKEEAKKIECNKMKCFGKELWAACLSCTVGAECQKEYTKIQKEKEDGKRLSAKNDKS